MKKTFKTIAVLVLVALAISVFATGCGNNGGSDFVVENKEAYDFTTETQIHIEYGDAFTVPTVKSANGEEAICKVSDADGEMGSVAYIPAPQKGDSYTMEYTFASDANKKYTLTAECSDTKAPELNIRSFFNEVLKGETVTLPNYKSEDKSGVDVTASRIYVQFNGQDVAVTNDTFVASQVGTYHVFVYVKDKNETPNEKTYDLPVTVTESFTDPSLSTGEIFAFDKAGYANLVKQAYGNSEVEVSIETDASKFPAASKTNAEMKIHDGGLKIVTKDDNKSTFVFKNELGLNVDDDAIGQVVLRVYSSETMEHLTVSSLDGTVYMEKKNQANGWHEYSFTARTSVGWYDDLGDLVVTFENEDASTIWFDSIFYTEQWMDPDIDAEGGVLADFDEEGYLNIVTQNTMSKTADLEIITLESEGLTDEDRAVLAGANGGVLKVTTHANFDGFMVTFNAPVNMIDLTTLKAKMYFPTGKLPQNSRAAFIDVKGEANGTGGYHWQDNYSGGAGAFVAGWETYEWGNSSYFVTFDLKDSPNTIAFEFAYYQETEVGRVFYIDEISCVYNANDEIIDEFNVKEIVDDEETGAGTFFDFDENSGSWINNVGYVAWSPTTWNYPMNRFAGYEMGSFTYNETTDYGVKLSVKQLSAGHQTIAVFFPETVEIADFNDNQLMGSIFIEVYSPKAYSPVVGWGVLNGAGGHSATGSAAGPIRYGTSLKQGYNAFEIPVDSLMREGIYSIRGVIFSITSLPQNDGANAEIFITKAYYSKYVAPYEGENYLEKFGDEEEFKMIADFEVTDYNVNVQETAMTCLEASTTTLAREVELDHSFGGSDTRSVLKVTTGGAGYSNVEYRLPETLQIYRSKKPVANNVYVDLYVENAIDNAQAYLAVLDGKGSYCTNPYYLPVRPVITGLQAGWNTLAFDTTVFTSRDITSILRLVLFVDIKGAGTYYIDKIYMDSAYTDPVIDDTPTLAKPVVNYSTDRSGTKPYFTASWQEVENATSYEVWMLGKHIYDVVKVTGGYQFTDITRQSDNVTVKDSLTLDATTTTQRIKIVAKAEGYYSSERTIYFDKNNGAQDKLSGGFVIADFTVSDAYADVIESLCYAETGYVTESTFARGNLTNGYGTHNGMLIKTFANNASGKNRANGGFTYYFNEPLPEEANSLAMRIHFDAWGVSHYGNQSFGVVDSNGKCYYVSQQTTLTNTAGTSNIYKFKADVISEQANFNQISFALEIDVNEVRALHPEMGDIVGVFYGHGKYATMCLEAIYYFDDTREYAINYNMDGGLNPAENPVSYNVTSDEITLVNPTRWGYDFLGWTSNTVTTPTIEYKIPTGSTGIINVYANWKVKDNIVPDEKIGTASEELGGKIIASFREGTYDYYSTLFTNATGNSNPWANNGTRAAIVDFGDYACANGTNYECLKLTQVINDGTYVSTVFNLKDAVATSNVKYIGVRAVGDVSNKFGYSNFYFRINDINLTAAMMSCVKSADPKGEKKAWTTNTYPGNDGTAMVFYIDVEEFLKVNPSVASIENLLIGFNKGANQTFGITDIWYVEK